MYVLQPISFIDISEGLFYNKIGIYACTKKTGMEAAMGFEILTDSSANLSEEMIAQYKIKILPLSFFIEETEYLGYEEGKVSDLAFYYEKMRQKKPMRTSLVNVELAYQICEEILENGRDLLYIGFSSGLSGTYQAVSNVLDELKEKYPERKIFCVDSLAAALGEGLLVRYVIDLREEGKKIEEVYQWAMENRLHVCHWFTVEDLFFLKRGGRIGAAAAVAGTVLSIKPVLHVDDEGHLIVMEKVRGRKKSLDALIRHMEETALDLSDQYIYISHGDCLSDAQYLADAIEKKFHPKEIFLRILDPVIGTHSGPGTVALFYLGTKR